MSCSEELSDGLSDSSFSFSLQEDLQEVAYLLGIPSLDLVFTDRFKVDRLRLELILFGDDNEPAKGTEFFDHVMSETNTKILWPSRIKKGARSRKDLYIKVMGLVANVQTAKAMLRASLETKSKIVTMKIDLSYTQHSHIIGRGGQTIKSVMEDTQCHIHFPDSNKNNPYEKSNQVSITGQVKGVETARARLRELTPVSFSFELPVMSSECGMTEWIESFIKVVEREYKVQVMLNTRQKPNSSVIVVKGNEWEVSAVKEATTLLIKHTCSQLQSEVEVQMVMQISPRHLSLVLGHGNENIRGIMQRTGTHIVFVDPDDPNIPNIKKSNVTITGHFYNVYLARQQITGSLPVVLMFDVQDDLMVVDYESLEEIMKNLDVVISVRNKPKQRCMGVIIKGVERNIGSIYEARRQILRVSEEPVKVCVPASYHIPNPGNPFRVTYSKNLYLSGMQMAGGLQVPPVLVNHPQCMYQWTPVYGPMAAMSPYMSNPIILHHVLEEHLRHHSRSSLSLPEMPVSYVGGGSEPLSNCTSPRGASPLRSQPLRGVNGSDSELNSYDWRAPGAERKAMSSENSPQTLLSTTKGMDKSPGSNDLRVPPTIWSSYGLNQSAPQLNDEEVCFQHKADGIKLGCSSFANGFQADRLSDWGRGETTPQSNLDTEGHQSCTDSFPNDLYSLLASLALEKYIPLFMRYDIDMNTFKTLTEYDLVTIGISSYVARKKIIFCINDINRGDKMSMNTWNSHASSEI